jgi:hypothetical protein
MELHLVRFMMQPLRTFGHLRINGALFCTTLEDTDRKLEDGGKKIFGQTAIPRGRYQVKLSDSPRFKQVLPELIDVPQFSGVRIHAGNTEKDTEGCILVGQGISTDGKRLINSRLYLNQLMFWLETETSPIWLEVT